MSALDDLLGGGDAPLATSNTYRWGTVTGVNPLRVRLDGDTDAVASTPVALCPVRAGARVWVQLYGRQLVILGAALTEARAVPLGAGVDLNTVVETGVYHQPGNNEAASGTNYPAAVAGLLEVTSERSATSEYRYQRYSAYNNSGVWARSFYKYTGAGTWYAWKPLT